MKLETWELLMIRACKKNGRPIRTLRRIYGASRKIALEHTSVEYATNGLMEIITKLGLVRNWHDFIVEIDHRRTAFWHTSCADREAYTVPFNQAFLEQCVSLLRLTEVSKIPGYRSPRKFRDMACTI